MGKLLYSMIVSLDGYVTDREGEFSSWAQPDEQVLAAINEELENVSTYLLGRRMYEMMAVWETDAEVIERETAVTGVAPTPAGESATAGSAQSGSAPDHDVRAADAHRSWTFAVDAPIDRGRLRAVLEGLPAQFVRAKGILDDRGREGHRFAFDFDGARFDTRDFGPAGDDEGHVVLIAAQTHDRPDESTEAAVEAIAQVLGAVPRN